MARYLISYRMEDDHSIGWYNTEMADDPAEWAISVLTLKKARQQTFVILSVIEMTDEQAERWNEKNLER